MMMSKHECMCALTKLSKAQHPAWSFLAIFLLNHLMYTCSSPMSPTASTTPQSRRRKAERNCSGARGSLAFFSSFLGLQVPVSQNLRRRSRSPERESGRKSASLARAMCSGCLCVLYTHTSRVLWIAAGKSFKVSRSESPSIQARASLSLYSALCRRCGS